MGRKSTASCFKIISCAGRNDDSVDRDDIDASPENKSPDKRGWSFRKRSGRHRVLSNTVVVTEKITSSENKVVSEPRSISSEPQVVSNISEKTSDNIWTEELPNATTKNAAVSTTDTKSGCEEDDNKCEHVSDGSESAVLVIQAAVRRFLAQRQLVKYKNVVKLQAAVRGHLVRNHAVGTLRCVQAIVKMQALVRARREKGAQDAGSYSKPTYVSIKKLLSNRLARQLLESTPKTKQINIKCDPSKSDSAWKWLERWMSVSTPEKLESHAPEHDEDKVVNSSDKEVETDIPSNVGELTAPFKEEENLIHIEENSNAKSHEEDNPVKESMKKPVSLPDDAMDSKLNTEAQVEVTSTLENPVSEFKHKLIPENSVSETKPKLIPENPESETKHKPIPENFVSETKSKPIPENSVSETRSKPIPENPVSEIKPKPVPENPVSETEQKRTAKRPATDQPDSEGRKSVFGSRKASNPAFIAAQSRFEELTSMTKPSRPANSSNQDHVAVSGSGSSVPLNPASSSNQDHVAVSGSGSSDPLKSANSSNEDVVSGSGFPADISSSAPEEVTPEVEPHEHLVSQCSITVQNGGSECGTVLSITSTLDSPDQFEVESKKREASKVLNEAVGDKSMNIDDNTNNNIDIVMPEKQVDEKFNDSDIELEPKQEPESGHHDYKSNDHEPAPQVSVPGSPRSHITVPESQGTPSSQVSTGTKKSKSDKKSTSQKRKSWSNSKKPSVDSGPRSSVEQLPKDTKPGKRRNSFGSPKPDNNDREQSVPSYMQATESAKAKAVANISPALSPDVHDKETYLKKRHSLPATVNGRQGSPRIQRSMSQALQTTKGNSNQERKWQR